MSVKSELPETLSEMNHFLSGFVEQKRALAVKPTDIATADHIEHALYSLANNQNGTEDTHLPLAKILIAFSNKEHKRYFVDRTGKKLPDESSHKWSPGTNVIINFLDGVRHTIGREVHHSFIDPFGGSGALAHAAAIYFPTSEVTCSDIAYNGGATLNGDAAYYDTESNRKALLEHIANNFPDSLRPSLSNVRYATADAKELPFAGNSFDYIITDPPYGVNLTNGSYALFHQMLPELLRVTRKGGFFLTPTVWHKLMQKDDTNFRIVNHDLTIAPNGKKMSGFERSLTFIPKQEKVF